MDIDIDIEKIIELLTELTINYGTNLIGAVAVWIIGGYVIKFLINGFGRLLDKRVVDESLKPFLKGIVSAMMKALLVVTVLTMLGVEMTSFVAIIGAAGLAIGMALSGSLQNFAGGVIILLFKPFKVGDLIDAQGHKGTVHEIQIFNTILKTVDNKTVIIPNGGLSNSSMVNYSTQSLRRVDWTFGIAYGDDSDKAKEVLYRLVKADERVLSEPEDVFVGLVSLGDSSVNFTVRAWVNSPDYWGVFFRMNEEVYKTFGKEGLNIPFPQMDVHVHQPK